MTVKSMQLALPAALMTLAVVAVGVALVLSDLRWENDAAAATALAAAVVGLWPRRLPPHVGMAVVATVALATQPTLASTAVVGGAALIGAVAVREGTLGGFVVEVRTSLLGTAAELGGAIVALFAAAAAVSAMRATELPLESVIIGALVFVLLDRLLSWWPAQIVMRDAWVPASEILLPAGFVTSVVGVLAGGTIGAASTLGWGPLAVALFTFALLPRLDRRTDAEEANSALVDLTADFAAQTHTLTDSAEVFDRLTYVASTLLNAAAEVRSGADGPPNGALGEVGKLLHRRYWLVVRPPHRDPEWEKFAERTLGVLVTVSKPALDSLNESQALRTQAYRDALTGAINKQGLSELLETALMSEEKVALLFLDLDHFKPVNDTHGHAAGDEVLKDVVFRMNEVLRDGESYPVARVGGDEFIIVLRNVEEKRPVEAISRRILSTVKDKPYPIGDGVFVDLGASIGAAISQPGDTPERLMERADSAMYEVKEAGRADVRIAQ